MTVPSRDSRMRVLPHALPCTAEVGETPAPRGRLSLPPQHPHACPACWPSTPPPVQLDASCSRRLLPLRLASFAAGQACPVQSRGGSRGPRGPPASVALAHLGALTCQQPHSPQPCKPTDRQRPAPVRSSAPAKKPDYNSQEALREPALQAPGLRG